jgi:small subunit ribosomal protein S18
MTDETINSEAPVAAEEQAVEKPEVKTEETGEVKPEVKTAAAPREYQRREGQSGGQGFRPRPRTQFRDRDEEGGDERSGDDRQRRYPKFRKKICRFCFDKNLAIDYKDINTLGRFITDRGKILPRRVTGTCAKHQRLVAVAIKRARIIALIPFVEK